MLFRRIARIVARLGPFVVVIAVAAGAGAAPMTYFVGFSGVGTLPALGAFTYDAAAPGFSNFIVLWNGTLFDLTSAANAPNIGGACAGAASSPETGFALMDHSMCGGLFSRWFGNQDVASSTFGFYNETLALPAQTGATILATGPGSNDPFSFFGAGEWTLTELPGGPVPPSAPEPSTAMLVLLAGLIIAACRAIPTRRRLSS